MNHVIGHGFARVETPQNLALLQRSAKLPQGLPW